MNGFALPRNFIEDPEKLLRKKKFVEARDKFESPSRTPSVAQASSSEEPALTLEEESEEQIARGLHVPLCRDVRCRFRTQLIHSKITRILTSLPLERTSKRVRRRPSSCG